MYKGLELFEAPRVVLFGPGAVDKFGHVLAELKLGRGIILTGHVHSRAIADKVASQCPSCSVVAEDEVDLSSAMANKDRFSEYEFVAGVGGGRVIDKAKALAYILGKYFISIPTVASHDGIASPYVSHLMQLELNSANVGKVKKTPIAIIADTSIIGDAPRVFLMAGIGELLGKRVALLDWMLGHRIKGEDFSEAAAVLAHSSYRIIISNLGKLARFRGEESARVVVKALIGCGMAMAIAGSTRPCSGSEHMFSHALDMLAKEYGLRPAMHGMQVALASVVMLYLHGLNWRRQVARLKMLNLPTSFRQLGYDRDIVLEALTMAHRVRPDRYTILGAEGLTREAAERALEETGVV